MSSGNSIEKKEDDVPVWVTKLYQEIELLKETLKEKVGEERLVDVITALSACFSSSEELSKELSRQIWELQKKVDCQGAEIQDLKANHAAMKATIAFSEDGTMEAIQRLDGRLEAIYSHSLNISNFNRYTAEVEQKWKELEEKISSIQKGMDFLKHDLMKMDSWVKNHEICDERTSRWIDSFNADLRAFEEGVKEFERETEKLVASSAEKTISILRMETGNLKEDLMATPNSIASLRSELWNRTQALELDAQNAVLKSNNVDSQMKILEKKIDNILNQIKKFELKQG